MASDKNNMRGPAVKSATGTRAVSGDGDSIPDRIGDEPENSTPPVIIGNPDFDRTDAADDNTIAGPTTKRVEHAYDSSAIEVKEGLEHVRTRPAMYIGDTDIAGYHHLIYEAVDNSIDEALAGHCTDITVTLHTDGSASIEDNGRGIPIGIHPEKGISAMTLALTTLGAGGKFNKKGYAVSGGLHGVGISVVNALSEWVEVHVQQNGGLHFQRFELGKAIGDVDKIGESTTHGTKVRFKPALKYFTCKEFQYPILANRLRELAFLNRGLTIHLRDERTDTSDHFMYKAGLKAFVRYLNLGRAPLHPDVIYFYRELTEGSGDSERKTTLEVAMQYTDDHQEHLLCFANNINTRDGGTHLSGFKSGLSRTLSNLAKNTSLVKDKGPKITGEDLRGGLTAIVSIKLPEPQFQAQTKAKLQNTEVEGQVTTMVVDALGDYFEQHPGTLKEIIARAMKAAEIREAIRRLKETMRAGPMGGGGLPGKLADCLRRSKEGTELYLVEGDSAGGTAKQGRDRNFQAILPLRGKLLNVEKARLDRILKNREILTIIQALGCGIEAECTLEKLRYEKVVLMTDADVDGLHIRTLLLTFFFRYMRPLVENGHIYSAQPPLFRVKKGKQERYVLSDADMKKELLDMGAGKVKLASPMLNKRWEAEDFNRFLAMLTLLETITQGLRRKGIILEEYLKLRHADQRYPTWKVALGTQEQFCFSEAEAVKVAAEMKERYLEEIEGGDNGADDDAGAVGEEDGDTRIEEVSDTAEEDRREARAMRQSVRLKKALVVEARTEARSIGGAESGGETVSEAEMQTVGVGVSRLHIRESEDLPKLLAAIKSLGLTEDNLQPYVAPADIDPDDPQTIYPFVLEFTDKDTKPIWHLTEILPMIRYVGQHASGIDVQRFKGLGEMNAEELWNTTMDPAQRILKRVNIEEAIDADRMFGILMGEHVEARREYIQAHALEVVELDV